MELTEFLAYWGSRVPRDLTPFADPGSKVDVVLDGRSAIAKWHSKGVEQEALFSFSMDSGVQVTTDGLTMSYANFFSSARMADLAGLARMILQSQSIKLFVHTQARRADDPPSKSAPALDVLHNLLDETNANALTRVVMVTGEAGAGKTRVLQELVRTQAEEYIQGQTNCLYLYVNAQGRALARFNEALATELQDLRASLTYHAVSTLVRLGLLVPVIDGFDELLGVGGYDDAFSSLAGFIEELNGEGQLIASARSAYYEQEFVSRTNLVSALGAQSWSQIAIEVASWGDKEFEVFLSESLKASSLEPDEIGRYRDTIERVFKGRNAELRNKPLFVARTVDFVLQGEQVIGEKDLLSELVGIYLERERRDKLLNQSGEPILTTPQLEFLMESLAEEMWNQETRELDRTSARDVAEYVLVTENIDEAAQRVVIERVTTMAFLMSGTRTGRVTFEHEMFFAFFLARVFARYLTVPATALAPSLGRAVLPPEVATTAIELLSVLKESSELQKLLKRLGDAAALEGMRAAQVRENAGLLAATALGAFAAQERPVEGIVLRNLVLPGTSLRNVYLTSAHFEATEFRRVDLSRARFVASRSTACTFLEAVVDPGFTRLELSGLDPVSEVFGLRRVSKDAVELLYDPVEIRETLVACGAVADEPSDLSIRKVDRQVVKLLERFVRAYQRANPVCTGDDNLIGVFTRPEWKDLERLLIDSGVVTPESRATGGAQKLFLRRQALPDQILAGINRTARVPENVRRFWDALESEAAPR